jgi:hypothetical protein
MLDILKDPSVLLVACVALYLVCRSLKGKVSDRLLPVLSTAGGIAIGVAHGLGMGEGPKAALMSTLTGLVAGLAGSGMHENVKAAKAPPSAPAGDGPPTPKSPRAPPPSDVARIAWATGLLAVWGGLGLTWAACTAGERKTAADIANAAEPVCEEGLRLLAAPELAGLCVGVTELESIIAELVSEHSSKLGSTVVGDGGMRTAAPWRPSMADVHRRLAAKRAKDAGK